MSAPFVGRQRELAALVPLVGRAFRDRTPTAALVSGDPGSGKTALLAEAMHRIRAPRSVRVAGFEPMQAVPLAAVGDLLRTLAKVPGDGATLDRLAFAGADVRDRDPLRIFEAAHRCLGSLGPILIAIDDVQWADERSIALVHYILRAAEPTRQPIAVLAAARPSPAAATFRASVESDLPADRRAFIDLGPLALEDGRALAQAIDTTLGDVAAADLWRRAKGSPFWLEALATSGTTNDPSNLIRERLRDLGPEAGALLAALAVGARPFVDVELAGLLDWKIERVRHAARELFARGLALELTGTIRLAHDLIREAAAASLPLTARRRLHARLAEWIEGASGDDLPLLREALEHRVAAGMPAAELAARVLSSPQRRLLDRDGLRLIASISDRLEPGAPGQADVDRDLGELAAILGDQQLALDRWRRLAETTSDPIAQQGAHIEAARAAYRLRRADDAHAHLDRAQASAPPTAETAVTLDALRAEMDLWLDHDTARGSATARRSLAAALEMTAAAGGLKGLTISERRASLAAHDAAIDAALQEDRADDVLRISEASVLIAEGLDEDSHIASLMRPAFGLRPLGRVRESEARYREAWTLAREHILPMAMVEAGHGLGRVLRDLGRLDEAHEIAAETVELERRMGHPPRRWGNAASIVHLVELARGETAAIDALRRDAETEPDPHYRLAIHQQIAAWQARNLGPRAHTEVVRQLDSARSAARLAGCPRCSRELAAYTAESLARVGEPEEARRELASWEASARSDYLMRRVWGTRAQAAIDMASGEAQAAISALDGLVERLESAGLVDDLLWARIDLGHALSSIDRARSIEVYGEAAALAERIGARSQGRLATQALRRLGVRAWKRGPAEAGEGLGRLSAREREVALHVSGGASNREIADELALSPKTVERHVTNILAKFGLRNRTELAGVFHSGSVRGSPDE